MTDRTYRRSGRDRYDRDRGFNRQAEQFDATDYGWRDEERGYSQMGEGWRDEDFGQFDTAGQSYGREAPRERNREPGYARRGEFRDDNRPARGWFDRAADSVAGFFADDGAFRRPQRDFRGQGPLGYVRSDERILEDANDTLAEDWAVDARQISVAVSSGEVTLDGAVPSRRQKRRAEDLIDDLSGVKNVQNNLRVRESDQGRIEAGTAGAI